MRKRPFRFLLVIFVAFVALGELASQDILTSTNFFAGVAERYAGIADYSADVTITIDGTTMRGSLYYRRPNRIRIDFTTPQDQVIVSDGINLQVYIPKYNVILNQKLDPGAGSTGLATQEGLNLLRRGYSIAYKAGPNAIPLDEGAAGGSSEQVTKLALTWRNNNEGFREIEISVTQGKLIRRIEGITADRKKVRIDYSNIRYNQGIPDTRFEYESPGSANNYNNFLFGTN